MKTILLIIILFISNTGYSQWLNFNDLKYIYFNDIEKVDSYLTKKGFEFQARDESPSVNNKPNQSTTWIFKGQNVKSTTFVSKDCDMPQCGFTMYNLNNLSMYTRIRDSVKNGGFKLKKSNLDELGNFEFIYSDNKYDVIFSTGSKRDINTYYISFTKAFN